MKKQSQCQNCDLIVDDDQLEAITDIMQRVAPGEHMPSGQCPSCGALCHPVEEDQVPPIIQMPAESALANAADAARWRAMCACAAAEEDEMVTFLDDHTPDGPITKEHLDIAMDAWMQFKGLI